MRRVSQTLILLLLSALLVAPFNFGTPTAHAQSSFISDLVPVDKLLPKGLITEENREQLEKSFKKGVAACAIMTYIMFVIDQGSFKVPVSAFATELKEDFIDCVIYNVVNVLIEDMLRSLTKWVQGGFKGNPVFVTRLNGHIGNLADRVAGEFIKNTVPFLCSPFRAQIQLQLIQIHKQNRGDYDGDRLSCTFSESMENVKDFIEGDFSAGGWDMWFETFSNPANNPYGAYIEASKILSARINSATGEARVDINLGAGFLSRKRQTCYVFPGGDQQGPPQPFTVGDGETIDEAKKRQNIQGSSEIECDEPETVTPGSFIEDQINEKYGSPGRRLEMADEMNELINAVILYIVGNIFKDEDGLSGYDIDSVSPVDLIDDTIDDDLPGPGGNDSNPDDSEPAGPPGESMCFDKRGVFLVPEEGATETAGFQFAVPMNVSYDSVEVSVDLKNNGWWADREGWPVMPFWFVRDGNKNMYGYVKIDAPGGPSGRELMLAHGIGVSHAYKTRVKARPVEFPEGSTYRFKEVYDAKNQRITLTVTDLGSGRVIRTLTSTPTVPGINTGNEKFRIGIGYSPTEANPHERPAYGWEYSNLKVSFISSNGTPGDCATPSSWNGSTDRPSDPPDNDGPPLP
ncbi:MAG: hypothetical protein KBD16_00515 [Candidatus Pacebacteria bacterium]|nr:hypothetical protein [Candidatus Paceibacterota bacterium]